jgi:hypothetical protein
MRTSPILPKPSVGLIQAYLEKWKTLENYIVQEKCLALLFRDLCLSNDSLEHVLLKVTALNQFYSTNIFDTFTVAKHIIGLNIEPRLKAGDYALVNEIASIKIKGKVYRFYSFSSKYCNHHLPETFPIYDSFVKQMLIRYSEMDKFNLVSDDVLKDYGKFVSVIIAFREFYHLNQFSLREIDIFLWLAGKEYFPRTYKRKSTKTGGMHRKPPDGVPVSMGVQH